MSTINAYTENIHYKTIISNGRHTWIGDEPLDVGGLDTGPSPYELLLSALATCIGATVRMYADRKAWPLEKINISLSIEIDKEEQNQHTKIIKSIQFEGDLDEKQKERLYNISDKCPVSKMLTQRISILHSLS